MSEITLPEYRGDTIRIRAAKVYDLDESVAASKYPMQTDPDPKGTELTPTAVRLARCAPGTGHDNWLCGIRAAFDLTLTAKCLIEAERYHFLDIVSCNSTMHRITRFDPDRAYCRYVDRRAISVMVELIDEYNADPAPAKLLRILYTNPAGFLYTLRADTNYRQLKTVYAQRRDHRLIEWRELCGWIETLPHAELIMGGGADLA